jgi:hypothetical protein
VGYILDSRNAASSSSSSWVAIGWTDTDKFGKMTDIRACPALTVFYIARNLHRANLAIAGINNQLVLCRSVAQCLIERKVTMQNEGIVTQDELDDLTPEQLISLKAQLLDSGVNSVTVDKYVALIEGRLLQNRLRKSIEEISKMRDFPVQCHPIPKKFKKKPSQWRPLKRRKSN